MCMIPGRCIFGEFPPSRFWIENFIKFHRFTMFHLKQKGRCEADKLVLPIGDLYFRWSPKRSNITDASIICPQFVSMWSKCEVIWIYILPSFFRYGLDARNTMKVYSFPVPDAVPGCPAVSFVGWWPKRCVVMICLNSRPRRLSKWHEIPWGSMRS